MMMLSRLEGVKGNVGQQLLRHERRDRSFVHREQQTKAIDKRCTTGWTCCRGRLKAGGAPRSPCDWFAASPNVLSAPKKAWFCRVTTYEPEKELGVDETLVLPPPLEPNCPLFLPPLNLFFDFPFVWMDEYNAVEKDCRASLFHWWIVHESHGEGECY